MENTQDTPRYPFLNRNGRRVSYTRIGPADKTDSQKGVPTEFLFIDKTGCKSAEYRPELKRCLAFLETKDVLFVKSMDRLGRNTKELLELVEQITNKGTGILFMDEGLELDPATPDYEAKFRCLKSMHNFERTLAQERRNEGLIEAKEKGISLGRPTKINDEQRKDIHKRLGDGEKAYQLAKEFGISKSLVYTIGRGE
jgi:DNA invertase Pin-like site-specific DNA recombinase